MRDPWCLNPDVVMLISNCKVEKICITAFLNSTIVSLTSSPSHEHKKRLPRTSSSTPFTEQVY